MARPGNFLGSSSPSPVQVIAGFGNLSGIGQPRYHRRPSSRIPLCEESSYWSPSGSCFFCHPAEVLNWSENVSLPVGVVKPYLPSPPESECFADSQDMVSQRSQTSMSEEWPTVSTADNGHYYHTTWQGSAVPVTAQDLLDVPFLSTHPSTVSSVQSPVLSHESQSYDTLNSFSEPDLCELPPGLDLSFASEPSWNHSSPVIYNGTDVPDPLSGVGFTPLSAQSPYSFGCSVSQATATFPGMHGPMFYPQGGQVAYQKRSIPSVQSVSMRPIRRRTDGLIASSQSFHGQQQAGRPHMPLSHGSQYTVSSVSSSTGQSADGARLEVTPSRTPTHITGPSQYASHGSGLTQSDVSAPVVSYGYTTYGAPASLVSDPTDEDFSAYIHYDHEDHAGSLGALSFTPGYGLPSTHPSSVPEDVKPILAAPQHDRKATPQGSSVANSLAGENDEGRHRTHPLYSEGPKADGLYHCPYKAKDPNCPHKPTKLKCNYDKFIDSHLKPFRCKVDSCAKQEFSSTACLLRHEREAHGMHGHGERPHLCLYSGCERNAPGNGFPRRYNLFDHMKRVHDHKEDLADSTGSPAMGADGQKRAGARKRKGSASPPAPVAQRPKAMPMVPQQAQAMYYPTPGYLPQSVYDATQWTNQNALVPKHMDIIQGQNAELRRLSAHTQRR